jgi:16S rRNA (adenine1518-N6/adenine1519-N6)-dimethyltransferase
MRQVLMTDAPLQAGAVVLAVEKDHALATKLGKDLEALEALKVIQGDILRLNIDECIDNALALRTDATGVQQRIKVVSSLPFYITTDLLKQLLPKGDVIESLALILQHEAAQSLTDSHPGVLYSCSPWQPKLADCTVPQ